MKRVLIPALGALLLLGGGCATGPDPNDFSADPYPAETAAAAADTQTFAQHLSAHLALPAARRAEGRAAAEAELTDWDRFEGLARHDYDRTYKRWYYHGTLRDDQYFGYGVMHAIRELSAAVQADPSLVEAWAGLGHLSLEVGDLQTGLRSLDNARQAVAALAAAGAPTDPDLELAILVDRAWALRDLARWDDGLAAVEEGLAFSPGQQDLVLIRGLLLAGAGRTAEAIGLARRLEPFRYRLTDEFHRGIKFRDTDFANRWIRSQALLSAGDVGGARHALGNMEFYPYRHALPHMARFWKDVGLVCELADDPEADIYYSIGFISNQYYAYFPHAAENLGPLVLDVPNPLMPYFTSYGKRFYLGGSPFSYIAGQMNLMAGASFPEQRAKAAGNALQMLGILERRGLRPDVCRALRGRIYFSSEDFQAARAELLQARAGFAAQDLVDAGTSFLLGMLDLRDEDFRGAVPFLEEAVAKDPAMATGWRSLGVAYASSGRNDLAQAAMDRALALDPRSLEGLYNRGLLHLQQRRYVAAITDLSRAQRLEPENHEVLRLLQMAETGRRQESEPLPDPMVVGRTDPGAPPPPPEAAQEQLAQLEADIEALFAVPDSVAAVLAADPERLAELERRYAESVDPALRKPLALAWIDQGRYESAQALLAPGWGVDLEPDEELMLLYVDRLLGEQARSEALAAAILRGEAGTGNPHLLPFLTMRRRNDTREAQSEVLKDVLKWCFSARTEHPFFVEGWRSYLSHGISEARRAYLQDPEIGGKELTAEQLRGGLREPGGSK